MQRFVIAAMACGVWLAGAASAATLVHVLRRPLQLPTTAHAEILPSAAVERLDPAFEVAMPRVLELPVITIVGRRLVSAPRVPRAAAPVVARDIADMNCADWRDLEMGSGRVQVCQ